MVVGAKAGKAHTGLQPSLQSHSTHTLQRLAVIFF